MSKAEDVPREMRPWTCEKIHFRSLPLDSYADFYWFNDRSI